MACKAHTWRQIETPPVYRPLISDITVSYVILPYMILQCHYGVLHDDVTSSHRAATSPRLLRRQARLLDPESTEHQPVPPAPHIRNYTSPDGQTRERIADLLAPLARVLRPVRRFSPAACHGVPQHRPAHRNARRIRIACFRGPRRGLFEKGRSQHRVALSCIMA